MDFTSVNARLLTRYGGDVTLSRLTEGPPPQNPWDPPSTSVIVSEALRFIATDAATELVASGVVLADDLLGVMALPGAALVEPKIGDTVTADGKAYTLLSAKPVHSVAGDAIHYAIHARTA
ncbi:hypothetical protein D6851_05890 [Altericroceibacterium spongiae]|uniref:Uncharacterized protein n=1 Tax=Altericroceibacterium spongiae TaxID=2320269 RepID=A0A420EPY5_9SPHN|nr:hypothetical protein [Altericroceibacterium spongiae]RKF22727.1 hypothetical protein D6851_05890 [Altericroceibacterium spongiae]